MSNDCMNTAHQTDITAIIAASDSKQTVEKASDSALITITSRKGSVMIHVILDTQDMIEDVTYQYTLASPIAGGVDTFTGEMSGKELRELAKVVSEVGKGRRAKNAMLTDLAAHMLLNGYVTAEDLEPEPKVIFE